MVAAGLLAWGCADSGEPRALSQDGGKDDGSMAGAGGTTYPGGSGGGGWGASSGSGGSGAGGSGAGGAGGSGAGSGGAGSGGAAGAGGAGPCLARGSSCAPGASCCGDLTCGSTTAGQVCCGEDGASCATPDGADCCGTTLICVGGSCQAPGAGRPVFSAPYPCGERWTYSHHSQEVRLALDFVRADGGATDGAPVLASAPGVATRHVQAGGAGNYIMVTHGDGWITYYFHLSAYSVEDGTWVSRGQEVGRVGSTGASSGPHLHYEQLRNGAGQTIEIEGSSLAPYPSGYFQRDLVSENGCGEGGRNFSTWGSNRPVYERATQASPQVTQIASPSSVFIDCQTQGQSVVAEGYTNDWWSHLRDHGGYISNIYINDPAPKLPGIPNCP